MNITQDERLAALQQRLPELRLLTDGESLVHYGQDWTRVFTPAPLAIALPANTEEVQAIVAWANQYQIALVPSGGRTGLSGAAVANNGELVLSFERMNKILDFNPLDLTVTVQPGVVTEVLQNHAKELGLYYPVDFASRGSSQIGGNIATNAGGLKVIRYGLTRQWVTGLKVVTGKGELLELNQGLIKNASGYDLRHLFIGSEGTLGLIVEATIQLTRVPRDLTVMVLGAADLAALMEIFAAFRQRITLSAFEFFSDKAMHHVLAKGVAKPFEAECPYYVLLEFETDDASMEAALAGFEYCAEQGWLVDGVVSQSQTQAAALWRLREDITESIAPYLPYKNDISVRISQVADFLSAMDQLFASQYPDFEVVWFGHIGDGNLHISVLKPEDMDKSAFVSECGRVSQLLFATLQKFGGSISAEHGVGLTKKPYLHYTRRSEEVAYLRAIKQAFDPNHILNPGKVFD